MKYFHSFVAALAFVLACACSSHPPALGVRDSGADATPVGCDLHTAYADDDACRIAPTSGFQIHYGPTDYDDPEAVAPYVLTPGDEQLKCAIVDNPVTGDDYLTGYTVSERKGMHHMNVGTTPAPDQVAGPCSFPGGLRWIFIAQRPQETQTLDGGSTAYKGAAYHVAAEYTHFAFQAHGINETDADTLMDAWVQFVDTREAPSIVISGLEFDGGKKMAVPPGAKQTVSGSVIASADETVLALVGHMHSHGVEQTASIGGARVYDDTDWSEPTWSWYTAPPLHIVKGAALSFGCAIDNTSAVTLRYANRVETGEMCNLYGFVVGANSWTGSFL